MKPTPFRGEQDVGTPDGQDDRHTRSARSSNSVPADAVGLVRVNHHWAPASNAGTDRRGRPPRPSRQVHNLDPEGGELSEWRRVVGHEGHRLTGIQEPANEPDHMGRSNAYDHHGRDDRHHASRDASSRRKTRMLVGLPGTPYSLSVATYRAAMRPSVAVVPGTLPLRRESVCTAGLWR